MVCDILFSFAECRKFPEKFIFLTLRKDAFRVMIYQLLGQLLNFAFYEGARDIPHKDLIKELNK